MPGSRGCKSRLAATAPLSLSIVDPRDSLDPRFWAPDGPAEPRYIWWGDTEVKARVDPEIYDLLARWSWNAFTTMTAGKTYFRRGGGSGRTTILLHREVLRLHGLPAPEDGQRWVADHIDGHELDCRIRNLRWTTYGVNSMNRRRAA